MYNLLNKEVRSMTKNTYNQDGVKKLINGMKKATEKYSIPTKKKNGKKK